MQHLILFVILEGNLKSAHNQIFPVAASPILLCWLFASCAVMHEANFAKMNCPTKPEEESYKHMLKHFIKVGSLERKIQFKKCKVFFYSLCKGNSHNRVRATFLD